MNQQRDGLELLQQDHRAVFDLFDLIQDIPAAAAADSVDGKRRRMLFEEMSAALTRHASTEEALLYPLARTAVPESDELVDHAVSEHQEVRLTLARLERMSIDNLDFEGELRALMADVRDHVDEEENELFPLVREHVTREQLAQLGQSLIEAAHLELTEH